MVVDACKYLNEMKTTTSEELAPIWARMGESSFLETYRDHLHQIRCAWQLPYVIEKAWVRHVRHVTLEFKSVLNFPLIFTGPLKFLSNHSKRLTVLLFTGLWLVLTNIVFLHLNISFEYKINKSHLITYRYCFYFIEMVSSFVRMVEYVFYILNILIKFQL
jgi:hypothetical protein